MSFEPTQAVADAILYEGYLLYPYRRSSEKNRVRWQFGVLAPKGWLSPSARNDASITGSADGWYQQTECLLEAPDDATVRVRVRFLQLQHRSVQSMTHDGSFEEVDTLTVDGRRLLTFDDAVPREHDLEVDIAELRRAPCTAELRLPAGERIELLPGEGRRVLHTWESVSATVRLSLRDAVAPFPLSTLTVVIENSDVSTPAGISRPQALRASLIATHTLIGVSRGALLSLLDPPAWAANAAKSCRNIHTFPVLAGAPGRQDVVLSSPILLYDHPQVSPESPGDLFDATEIDEILSLRTAALTDEEKDEARATDPRAAAIIDRAAGLPREVMERLHGAVRSMRPHRPGADNTVTVDGFTVRKGTRVRLCPRGRGTDAHDIFLAGRTALVEAVLTDLEGKQRIAVTVDDDPGADLHQWYGRFYYFAPDEVLPMGAGSLS